MASTSSGISGMGLAVVVGGAILVWSGIQNRGLVESLRYLAEGKPIPTGTQKTTPISFSGTSGGILQGGGNASVVSIAASLKGQPYVFGAGHRKVCDKSSDCSGYVSCVLNKAGLMKGTLNTDGFARWGTGVSFEQRQPGDILVWVGGPGGGHCGIVIDANTMWHNPCTGCGGVQIGRYGKTRTGRPTIVRRAKSAGRTVQV